MEDPIVMTENNTDIGHRPHQQQEQRPPQFIMGSPGTGIHNNNRSASHIMNGLELSPMDNLDNSTKIITRRPFETSPMPPSPAENSREGVKTTADSVVALRRASSHSHGSLLSEGDLSRLSRRSRGSTSRNSGASRRRRRGGGGRPLPRRARASSPDSASIDNHISDEFLSDGSGDFFEAGSVDGIEVDEASGDGYSIEDDRGYVLDDQSMTSHGTYDDGSLPSLGSSGGGSSRRGQSGGGGGNRDEAERLSIAVRETQAVHCLRMIVILTLAILAALLAVTLYVVARDAEMKNFRDEFDDIAMQIGTAWKDHIGQTISALDTLSVYVTSATLSLSEVVPLDRVESVQWPFVTVPEFHIQCASIRQNLGSGHGDGTSHNDILRSISLVPTVTQQERGEYEIYTRMSTSTWINDATEWEAENAIYKRDGARQRQRRQRKRNLETGIEVEFTPSTGVASRIYGIRDEQSLVEAEADMYYPIRQSSPVVPRLVNYNLLSNGYAHQSIWQAQQSQSAEPLPLLGPMLIDESDDAATLLQFVPDNGVTNSSSILALGTLWYPIFDSFDAKDRKSVGYFFALISWPQFLADILPKNLNGVTCVVENSCSQKITLKLSGTDVEVVKQHAHTSSKYQDMVHQYELASLDLSTYSTAWMDSHTWYTQQEQNYDGTCHQYTLRVFPSDELEGLYATNLPVMYAVSVGLAFLLTAILFLLYDRLVERRQKLVLKSAVEARAIVSSLFPAVVRERLFQNTRERQDNNRAKQLQHQQRMSFRKGGDVGNTIAAQESARTPVIPNTLPRGSLMHEVIPESPLRSPSGTSKVPAVSGNENPALATTGASKNIGYPSIPEEVLSPNGQRDVMGTSVGPPPLLSPSNSKSFEGKENNGNGTKPKTPMTHPKHRLKNFLAGTGAGQGASIFGGNSSMDGFSLDTEESDDFSLAKPIADLFPKTTVLFGDIAGFTAWSSEREPEQVFTLLQTIYHAFDKIAQRRGVFKVETIGDCYVAVTGLPDPQHDHAVRMTKFARECMTRMNEVTKKLEVSLGPDTGDLEMRVGLHSGPVTAGVLQGEKSRFQLFGDTVNMASRMESTGERNRIQISQSTADLLTEAGKSFWIRPREKRVHAKGKGDVQTYWIVSRTAAPPPLVSQRSSDADSGLGRRAPPPRSRSTFNDGELRRTVQRATSDSLAKMATTVQRNKPTITNPSAPFVPTRGVARTVTASVAEKKTKDVKKRKQRLVEWQVELFVRLLKKICAARESSTNQLEEGDESKFNGSASSDFLDESYTESQFTESFAVETIATDATDWSSPMRSPDQDKPKVVLDRFGDNTSIPRRVDMTGLVPVRQSSFRGKGAGSAALQVPVRQSSFRNPKSLTRQSSTEKPLSYASLSMSMTSISEHNIFEDDVTPMSKPTPMDEVAEVIVLPKFTSDSGHLTGEDSIEISPAVLSQLHEYIKTIGGMYNNNPFHNFEHASHVTMSASKFLNRIVNPENVDYERETKAIASDLHDYTYGITSDPLTQFAIIFSALIHDCDHPGVPNGRLAVEKPSLAENYCNRSIAEQNSIDLAWNLLTESRFKDLQQCIWSNAEERSRFRQLVVNSVMATDIFEKDMKALRNKRWDKAFHRELQEAARELTEFNIDHETNMKATIVIEHIIQAADVAHTMQHWHIYTKWNERLFEEMYAAFEAGRSEKNPAEGWYKGEIWFFDNYVIPLAKKLEECHVFGVASDECLNYAKANRNEWASKGEALVLDMLSRQQKKKFLTSLGDSIHSKEKAMKPFPRRGSTGMRTRAGEA